MSDKSGASHQVIALPQGGGALSGIGETFSPDLHTGTGNFTVPIALPPGRNGFQPQLSLTYSTGQGNGPFGLGWSLSIPGVSRKTSHGIPRYRDYAPDAEDRDTFILSGAEDLVAIASSAAGITEYRPRTEGLFAHITHRQDTGNDYFEVQGTDGLVSRYGTPLPDGVDDWHDPAVVANPDNRLQVFAWKLSQTEDPFGNRIVYRYRRETGLTQGQPWEQLYLSEIWYADYGDDPENLQYLVKVTFDYEPRPDPFSDHRAGFEIRTTLRCRAIHIRTYPDGVETPGRAYVFDYLDPPPRNGISLLTEIRVEGRDGDETEVLPPLELSYTAFEPESRRYQPFTAVGGSVPDRSLDNPDYELVDLFGNGLPDVIQMNGTARYWRNLGDGRFDAPRMMRSAPAGARLADPGVQLADWNGDGRCDLLITDGVRGGYYSLARDGTWDRRSYVAYARLPSVDLEESDVKLVDLDGDGVTDALRTGTSFELFYSDRERGWATAEIRPRRGLDAFPNLQFSDPRVRLADLSGDGLQDIALIHNGRVEYWPYLGYGRWGRRITMKNSPRFNDRSIYSGIGYDPKRVLLGDVDGDGLADLIYVGSGRITVWINQSGNGWSEPITVYGTPAITDADAVRLVDMHGTGTSGILWTYDAGSQRESTYKFLDLTGGVKPYLLNRIDNHLGAVSRIAYASSTHDYLRDQQHPRTRWQTALPFPVQVVARVEVIDEISKGKLTTEYRYHHGYWDGAEREFRGFGMVEQFDTETFAVYNGPGLHGDAARFAAVEDDQRFSPPTLTRTWFHQGPVGEEFGEWQELDFRNEFWSGDPRMFERHVSVAQVLAGLEQRRDRRDALRALRGSVLRTELYALDNTDRQQRPYTVTEFQYGLREESPPGAGENARRRIFFPYPLAQRTTQWERGDDPMAQFTFTDQYDAYGQPQRQTQIGCPRGWRTLADTPAQPYLATRTCTVYAEPENQETHIRDRVAKTTTYELADTVGQTVLDLSARPDTDSRLNVISQTVNYYDGDAFVGRPFGTVGDHGALVRTESLVLTGEILQAAYGGVPPYLIPSGQDWPSDYPPDFQTTFPNLAGYTYQPGDAVYAQGYFVATDRRRYDFHDPSMRPRGLTTAGRDPFGRETSIEYDKSYHLLPEKVTDSAGLLTTARYDYRALLPRLVIDPNKNETEFRFSPLGLLKETWVTGNPNKVEGDRQRSSLVMEYDFLAFEKSPPDDRQPIFARTIRQVHHDTESDVALPERDQTIETRQYSDGFGRLLQTRTQGEDVRFGDGVFGGGESMLPADQRAGAGGEVTGSENRDSLKPNVVVSGWQVYDNKGRVVETYEPFFSTGWEYRSIEEERAIQGREVLGQKATMFYDPRGQVIRTLNPDGSEQRVIHGVPADLDDPEMFSPTPWEAYTYDANDNAGRTDAAAATAYRHHWNTPGSTEIDALGRTVAAVQRHRARPANPTDPLPPIEEHRTVSTYDIRGNLLAVTDALGRQVFTHVYDLANRTLRVESLDAGVRQAVLDARGSIIEQRDSKEALVLRRYDELNRLTHLWTRDAAGEPLGLRERLVYGDDPGLNVSPAQLDDGNLRGKLHRHYDEAGLLIFARYDFKGNVLEKTRRVVDPSKILGVSTSPSNGQTRAFRLDWQSSSGSSPTGLDTLAATLLDGTSYETSLTYDALGRMKSMRYPRDADGARKLLRPLYNRAGTLERVELDGAIYVDRITYNAKGQRTLIAYGNQVMTRYAYDDKTFRLVRMRSERYLPVNPLTYWPDGGLLQDLAYAYDLAGNIVSITDRVPGSGYLNNPEAVRMQPSDPQLAQRLAAGDALIRHFEYDPLYRLTRATGRESNDIPAPRPWTDNARQGFNAGNHGTPNQANAPSLTTGYWEAYEYDPAGNLVALKHGRNGTPDWIRHFGMGNLTPQQWEQAWKAHLNAAGGWSNPPGNQLTNVGDSNLDVTQNHFFDPNGNLTRENTDRRFEWDWADRLAGYRIQPENAEPSIDTRYLYDAAGQRVMKLVRRQSGAFEVTVSIDGIFEHHRWQEGNAPRQNSYLHVMDDQSRIALVRIGDVHNDDAGPAVQYHLGDHLGSSQVVLGGDNPQAGAFINREEYFPYGETSFGSFGRKRYRFTGKERDEESGLYYSGARYYAPWLGRWTSADPAGMVDGPNLYTYVRDNPLRLVDPNGTEGGEADVPGGDWAKMYNNLTPAQRAMYNWQQEAQQRINQDKTTQGSIAQVKLHSGQVQLQPPTTELSPYYSERDQAVDEPLLGWLPGARAGWYLMDAVFGKTISGQPVDRGQRLAEAGLSLGEDWMKLETAAFGARLTGSGFRFLSNRLTLSPTWSYGPLSNPSALGETSWTGQITIRPGLTGQDLVETVQHEAVHSLLSPRSPGPLQMARADLKAWGYWNSHLLRYTEEAAAETFATKSLSAGLKFPLTGGYQLSAPRILLEGAGYAGATGSLWYGTYKLTEKALEQR